MHGGTNLATTTATVQALAFTRGNPGELKVPDLNKFCGFSKTADYLGAASFVWTITPRVDGKLVRCVLKRKACIERDVQRCRFGNYHKYYQE